MSAYLSAVPDQDDHGLHAIGPRASLPGEMEEAEAEAEPQAPDAAPSPWWRVRRNQYFAGAAVAVLAVAAASVALVHSSDHVPARGAQTAGATVREPIVAPAAKVASGPTPAPATQALRPIVKIPPKDEQIKEIIELRDGPWVPTAAAEARAAAPLPNTPPASPPGPREVGAPSAGRDEAPHTALASAATSPAAEVASARTEGAKNAALTAAPPHAVKDIDPAPTQESAAGATPAEIPAAPAPHTAYDPVAIATALRPADMSPQQEIQVLSLVTELGTLIRDERAEVAALRGDQGQAASATAARLDDFERRLALAEARRAVDAAMEPAAHAVASAASASMRPPAEKGPHLIPASIHPEAPAPTANAAAGETRRYRVQAASPNLAMLAEIGRSGDAEAQLQIAIGDTVPGYGKVTRITQRGTAWVVETDHGTIE